MFKEQEAVFNTFEEAEKYRKNLKVPNHKVYIVPGPTTGHGIVYVVERDPKIAVGLAYAAKWGVKATLARGRTSPETVVALSHDLDREGQVKAMYGIYEVMSKKDQEAFTNSILEKARLGRIPEEK